MTQETPLRDFEVFCFTGNRYSFYLRPTEEFLAQLTRPQVDRVIAHCLAPEVGQHNNDRDSLCPLCILHTSKK